MRVLRVRNVHQALVDGLALLQEIGVWRDSRNGLVLISPEPVATIYERPVERVLFYSWRDANPFFHFYESLWMLAGRRDVEPLTKYVKRISSFSDDGLVLNAAYGDRWRRARGDDWKDVDQLAIIIDELMKNPSSRQCVLQIWDHWVDLGTDTKDHACNVAATFQINARDQLDMVIFCRSNDIIWGAYGANAVHFSMLHEYVSRHVGVEIGIFTQISVNWHAYVDVLEKTLAARMNEGPETDCLYEKQFVEPYPIACIPRSMWDNQVKAFVSKDGRAPMTRTGFSDPFFINVAFPIVRAHDAYVDGQYDEALARVSECAASDWRLACRDWILRRMRS